MAWLNGDSTVDRPVFPGKEVCWYVANDLDAARTTQLYGTQPVGMEVQVLTWSSPGDDIVGRTVYTKFTMINKGRDDLEDAYVARWADPDLGDAFDDYVGVDTSLRTMYCYNGYPVDAIYGENPPAVGVVMLQTPVVPQPGGRAQYDGGVREGYRNLPLSSFAFYINGSPVYTDPALRERLGAIQMYNYMTGKLWNGRDYINPIDSSITTFPLTGDPADSTGWVDGTLHTASDRRMLLSCGPFQLAVGDTQEVLTATFVVPGGTRRETIGQLRAGARTLIRAFDALTDAPTLPVLPADVTLGQNYPNPFGPGSATGSTRTSIQFTISRAGPVELVLYDALGRRVRTLTAGYRLAGTHTESFDAGSLSPGMYLCRLRAGGETRVRRLVLQR
jgi:hypothetical protein